MVNEFPFGMSQPETGLPFRNFCVPREFSSGTNRKNVYHLHPNQNFREFVVNGKQPGILSKKIYDDFFLIHPFCRFFREFWLARVSSFLLYQRTRWWRNAFTVNFTDNRDLRQGFKARLRDFWDREISRRTTQSHRDVFSKATMSLFLYQLTV